MPAAPARALAASGEDPLAPLVARMAQRDQAALATLYDKTVATLFALALRIVHDRGLAEEVCEDTFFQAWRTADRYDRERGRVMTWLMLMCRSRSLDALRALDPAEATEDPDALRAHVAAAEGSPAQALIGARADAAVQRAIEQLPAQERQAITLSFFRGLTHDEIATAWNMPVGSVKTVIHRAFKQLRTLCEAHWMEAYDKS
jgi:RNA polymerase sigma factor (sigma-70 family)